MKPLTISADRLSFLEDGKPWIQRGCLDWPLYGRYLTHGENYARDIFQDRRHVGANTIACAGMLAWPDLGFSTAHPNYWPGLRRFVEIAEQESIRIQWVVLCDTRVLMPNLSAQLAHWERFLVTLGDKTNVTFLLANQPGHPSQTITPAQTLYFGKPSGFTHLLCSRGNPFESANPVVPPMDFSCYCSSRRGHFGYVEVGSSMWYVVNGWPDDLSSWGGTHQASILFEPARIEVDNGWADPGKWRQLARSLAFKGTAGANIYSRQGRNAEILTGITRDSYVEFLGNIPHQ